MDWRIENIVTLVCTVVLVLGLYAMSNSWHALWGLLLMANINYPRKSYGKPSPQQQAK